jgi:hypothetical protein
MDFFVIFKFFNDLQLATKILIISFLDKNNAILFILLTYLVVMLNLEIRVKNVLYIFGFYLISR